MFSESKPYVLELSIDFKDRGELFGIDALSRTLFGKAAHGLDERKAAVAAALVRGPNAKAAQVASRACGVLQLMQSRPGCDSLDLFTTGALQRKTFNASEGLASHLARRLVAQTKEQSIQTTLRTLLQRFAAQTAEQHQRELCGRHVEDGAVLVLDNGTGEVLA